MKNKAEDKSGVYEMNMKDCNDDKTLYILVYTKKFGGKNGWTCL